MASESLEERHAIAIATSAPLSTQSNVRVSMEDYYGQLSNGSVNPESPPSYDATSLRPRSCKKFNIQPREDEGNEVLPAYSCAISHEAVFAMKLELESVVFRAQDRNWNKVYVTLQGTALNFYKCKGGGPFQLPGGANGPDVPLGVKKGALLKSYSLQHADVGTAADYFKKRYVIRIRAEGDQFLLSCKRIETLISWLQSLFAAIDLAQPLDDRQLPREFRFPRRRRRLHIIERDAQLVAGQQEIMRSQYPRLADDTIPEGEAELDDQNEDSNLDPGEEDEPIPSSQETSPSSSSTTISRSRAARSYSLSTGGATNAPHPSVEPKTGKWQPRHPLWSQYHNMEYAKRCMAVLTNRAPRKSNFVVMNNVLWVVDWSTGKKTKWEPPASSSAEPQPPAYLEFIETGEGEMAGA